MITSIVEVAIDLVAVLCGVGGVACLVYLIALLWRDHREWRAFLEDHRNEQAARRAAPAAAAFGAPHLALVRTPVRVVGAHSRSLPERP